MIEALKPYPAYKASGLPWVDQVPVHWSLPPNRALMRRRKVLVGSRHTEYRLLSLTKEGVIVRDVESGKGKFSADMGTSQEVRTGDLVFCLFDVPETPRTVGLSRHDGMITSAYTVMECPDGQLAAYLDLFYRAMDDRKLLSPLYSGLRNTIPPSRFLGTKTPVPPPDEQAAIARILDHADRRIRRYIGAKRRLIALLNEQKQAIIHRAVTRGLDPDVRCKSSSIDWLGDIPEHWNATRLKNVASVQTGITLGKNYGSVKLDDRPYLRVANVQAGRLNLTTIKRLQLPISEIARSTLRYGDVVMTEGGDIDKLGRGCVWRDEVEGCLHQNHVFAVRPNQSRLLPDYLVLILGSRQGRSYFEITAKRTTNLASTNSTTLGSLPLFLPGVAEQQQILDALSLETRSLETPINRAEREIDFLREYRTSLIADVVTGKLDVREAASRLLIDINDQGIRDEMDTLDDGEELIDDEDLDAEPVEVEA